jgi:hypothetical protein
MRVIVFLGLVLSSPFLHAIPEGPEPGTPEWTQRDLANVARSTEAPTEQASSPDFLDIFLAVSGDNRTGWLNRALNDPSWVGPPSLNTFNTPAGASWSSISAGDPTRYPQVEGPNGRAFYENEAEIVDLVFYDRGCARVTARVWAPRGWQEGDPRLPGVAIQNGSIQATQPMYWWASQALVRAGYVTISWDPRGQGRSDLQTTDGEQGGNLNSEVFFSGLVDTIDFFRSTPERPYPHNLACEGTYPTDVAPFNPFHARIDPARLGVAGHSLGASGISSVQGYPGEAFAFPTPEGENPIGAFVAWDGLGASSEFPPRIPAMGQSADYFAAGTPAREPPDPEGDKGAYQVYREAAVPVFQFTIQGGTHFEWSLVPTLPATSWCADISSGSCEGGWGRVMAEHYTVAWFDRWLKRPGEPGFDDADARLLDDAGWCERFSFYSRSARAYPDRGGKRQHSEDLRADCLVGVVATPSTGLAADGRTLQGGGAMGGVLPLLGLLWLLRRRRALAGLILPALAACGGSTLDPSGLGSRSTAVTGIEVLSGRADLISGGDALIEIRLPEGLDAAGVRVDLNGRDITEAFALRPNGRFMGLVRDLALGENLLSASFGSGGHRLRLINHPIGGPLFSGPQIQPWTCIGEVEDEQCNREPTVEFLYMPTAGGGFQPYDPASPPADVATTTTNEGTTVPFIVRVETGNLNRDEYRFAVLWDPAQPFEPWAPQPGFNRKLVIYHGASCHTDYQMASAPDVLNDAILGLGYATMSHALNNSGHNCNLVVQAEAMIMTKERVIETLGELRYTIGSGCSGGALAQQWVANAYPGLYQGITPACSFADAWSSGIQYSDYKLLRAYLEDPTRWSPGLVWDPLAIEAAIGHPNPANPITFTEVISDGGNPARTDCAGVPEDQIYHPQDNPGGLRCGLADYWINVIGRRPPQVWTENERLLGQGFAGAPFDNTGVQYGLKGLMDGRLSVAQFIDLNVKIGGYDVDRVPIPQRTEGDVFAIERIARSGGSNVGNNLDQVAIIDLRGPDPGAFHDVYRTYAVRARLEREHGTAENQALWRGPIALFGDSTFVDDSIPAMSTWLDAVAADTRDVSLAQKIRDNRTVADRCANGLGAEIPAATCDALVESYASPRIEAGMPFTDDVGKCQLKPHQRSDYFPIFFTEAQWAALDAAFPSGVCDYSQAGVGSTKTVPWLSYTDGPGGVPLGEPPVSTPF